MADYPVSITIDANGKSMVTTGDQIDKSFDKIKRSAKDASQSSTRDMRGMASGVGQAFQSLGPLVAGALSGLSFAAIASLREIGDAAQDVRSIWEGVAGSSEEALDGLRDATRRAVDDVTLMREAARLQTLGVAEDIGEATEVIGRATSLGLLSGVTDAGAAITAYVDLMNTQSTRQLNAFGLNVKDVQTRIEELKAAGLSQSDAFKQAVEEQADALINRMQPALEEQIGAWDRLQIRLENAKTGIAEFVATGIENGAMLVEQLIQIFELQQEIETNRRAAATTQSHYFQSINQLPGQVDPAGLQQALEIAQILTSAGEPVTSSSLAGIGGLSSEQITHIVNNYGDALSYAEQRTRALSVAQSESNQLTEDANFLLQEQAAIMRRELFYSDPRRQAIGGAMYQAGAALAQGLPGGAGMYEQAPFSEAYFPTGFASRTGALPELMSREDAERIADAAADMQELLDDVKAAEEAELITAEEAAAFRDSAAFAQDIAREADAAANALEKMGESLDTIFRQRGGGLGADIGESVEAYLKSQGVSQELIDALDRQNDVLSGAITPGSQIYDERVLPHLAAIAQSTELGPNAYATARANLTTFLENLNLQDLTAEEFGTQLKLGLESGLATGFMEVSRGGVDELVPADWNFMWELVGLHAGEKVQEGFQAGMKTPLIGVGSEGMYGPGAPGMGPGSFDFAGMPGAPSLEGGFAAAGGAGGWAAAISEAAAGIEPIKLSVQAVNAEFETMTVSTVPRFAEILTQPLGLLKDTFSEVSSIRVELEELSGTTVDITFKPTWDVEGLLKRLIESQVLDMANKGRIGSADARLNQ